MLHTTHLGLPLLAAAQAQKHVTHNEALVVADALVQLSVKESARASAPAMAGEGDRYIVGAPGAGVFAGQEGRIAFFDLGIWRFLAPRAGWRAFVEAESRILVYDGTEWRDGGHFVRELTGLERLGIGTTPDALNRLAAKLNAVLFTALTAGEDGTGDLRFVLNKEGAGDVLSQLYQSGYSGRAETGLVGDDDFRIRVSPDGSTWREALRVDGATGAVSFPSGAGGLRDTANLLINPECRINQRVFGGGVLAAGAYGYDRWKAGAGGCTLTCAGDGTVTLDGVLLQVIEAPQLAGETVTVSLEDPSGDIAVDVAGATGTIGAGSGRRSVTLSLPAGAVGDVIVTLGASAVSFARPMLNRGAASAPFERLPPSVELAMCRRYFAKTFAEAIAPAGNAGYGGSLVTHAVVANAIPAVRWQFPVPMRAVPSITLYNPAAADAAWSVGGVEAVVSIDIPTTAEAACIAADPAGSSAIAPGTWTAVHAVADAEL